MSWSTSDIMKGAGLGLLVGGIAAWIGGSIKSPKTNYKKMAKKAVKSAENFIDSMM